MIYSEVYYMIQARSPVSFNYSNLYVCCVPPCMGMIHKVLLEPEQLPDAYAAVACIIQP
jgi:hypothetical protein